MHPNTLKRQTDQPTQSIVADYTPVKHPDGTITLDIPEKAKKYLAHSESLTHTNFLNNSLCTPESPFCTGIRTKGENEKMDQIMASHLDLFAGVFGDDLVIPHGDTLAVRSDNDEDNLDEPLCTSRELVIHPHYGFDKTKRNLTIVNTEKHKQGVRVEFCVNADHPCTTLKLGHATMCKQMYYTRTLLAKHPEKEEFYLEHFILPSCCKCVKTRR